jgi:hypothetical protein
MRMFSGSDSHDEDRPISVGWGNPRDMTMSDTPSTGTSGSHNTHSRLSPSDAKRWVNCTASIAATAHIPKDDSVYASEGTEAHDWAEGVLSGTTVIDEVPLGMRPYIQAYVDHCNSLRPDAAHEVFIEAKVPLFYMPEENGTCDFAIISNDRIWIRDYKHGAGVLVEAEDNLQLAIYAQSFIDANADLYDFSPTTIVDIGIVQPRYRGEDIVRTWELTIADLQEFCKDVTSAVEKIRSGDTEFVPGEETCRWCPKAWKGQCPARVAAATTDFALPDIDPLDLLAALPPLEKEDEKLEAGERLATRISTMEIDGVIEDGAVLMTDDRLMALLRNKKNIIAFLEDAEELVSIRVQSGDNFGGRMKMVLGREGNRAWRNTEEAETFLKNQGLKQEERYDFTLISPTKAEKLLKDKLSKRGATRYKELVDRSPGKPVVAFAEDKRPAITGGLDALPPVEGEEDINI